MTETELTKFPSIHKAYVHKHKPSIAAWRPGKLHDAGDEAEINRIEEALNILLKRFNLTDLDEQITALFQPGDAKINQAKTELAGLADLSSVGCLKAVCWPSAPGTSARFEGSVIVSGTDIAFDIKDIKS